MTTEQVMERPALVVDAELQTAVVQEARSIIDQIGVLWPGDPQDTAKTHALLTDCAALRGSLVTFADLKVGSRTENMLTGRCVDIFFNSSHESGMLAVTQDMLAWMLPDTPPLAFLTEVAWGKFRAASAGVAVPAKISRLQYAKTFDHLKRIVGIEQPELQGAALDAAAYKLAVELMQRDIVEAVVS